MDEDLKKDLEELSKRDRRRLEELRQRKRVGTLSYTENIELELLESQEDSGPVSDEEVEAVKEGEYDRFKKEILGDLAKTKGEDEIETGKEAGPEEELVEFEYVPLEEEKDEEAKVEKEPEKEEPKVIERPRPRPTPSPRPSPKLDADPEKVKMGIAFGAGALMGYLLKDFLEKEIDEDG